MPHSVQQYIANVASCLELDKNKKASQIERLGIKQQYRWRSICSFTTCSVIYHIYEDSGHIRANNVLTISFSLLTIMCISFFLNKDMSTYKYHGVELRMIFSTVTSESIQLGESSPGWQAPTQWRRGLCSWTLFQPFTMSTLFWCRTAQLFEIIVRFKERSWRALLRLSTFKFVFVSLAPQLKTNGCGEWSSCSEAGMMLLFIHLFVIFLLSRIF